MSYLVNIGNTGSTVLLNNESHFSSPSNFISRILEFSLCRDAKSCVPIFFSRILISILIPLLFIQTGKVFEIIQMAWYYPILASLFAAVGTSYFFEIKINSFLKIIIAALLIVFTIPSAYTNFLSNINPFFHGQRENLSDSYFQTMNFLKKHGTYDNTVLELPSAETKIENLYKWYLKTSPHITAFANKRTFLSNEFIPFTNINIEPRIKFIAEIIKLQSINSKSKNYFSLKSSIEKQLIANKISFIYSRNPIPLSKENSVVKKVYENKGYLIEKYEEVHKQ